MKRRDFGHLVAAGSMGLLSSNYGSPASSASTTSVRKSAKVMKMHIGGGLSGNITREKLQFFNRYGVNHVLGRHSIIPFTPDKGWDINDILTAKEKCEKEGISLEMLTLPSFAGTIHYELDGSTYIRPESRNISMKNIVMGRSPQRDREIEVISKMIENAGKAGIRGIHYNFLITPHQRTIDTPGRGGVSYSSFDMSNVQDFSPMETGYVTRDEIFERIVYFHERVIPVAEENKVQMSCHPPDPPLKPGFRGVDTWDYPMFEGLKQFTETVESPYNGLTFCIGTVAEGLENINEIYKMIRYFGEKKKIFHVHFRNIRGGLQNFQEVFPDEGDMDMFKVAGILSDVGYPYMLMMDHTPKHPDPEVRDQSSTFQLGYIVAMVQAANRTV